jgi:hypothetical protein
VSEQKDETRVAYLKEKNGRMEDWKSKRRMEEQYISE